jgi:HNH endonuclease
MPLKADHIIPRAAGGTTEPANLCLCCRTCNGYKWRHTHARDPLTRRHVRLFHPRQQKWTIHFAWSEDYTRLIGLTATGQATIQALQMNNDLIMQLRRLWVILHLHPREKPP